MANLRRIGKSFLNPLQTIARELRPVLINYWTKESSSTYEKRAKSDKKRVKRLTHISKRHLHLPSTGQAVIGMKVEWPPDNEEHGLPPM